LTNYDELARFLALAIRNLGGSMKVSTELLDKMPPTRLVWDSTSQPGYITLATISNDVIMLEVQPSSTVVKQED
jgi:hypothetical protein